MTGARTVPDLLARLVRADAGRPLVTWYGHDAAGAVVDRTELSTTTYANWVAKVAGLLVDELDLERGDTLLLDLPTHWLTTVFWGAAWSAGLAVRPGDGGGTPGDAAAVVCGPGSLARWADLAASGAVPVVATALAPLAQRFRDGVPPGVVDLGVEVWSQPDGFVAPDPPQPDDVALTGVEGAPVTQGELVAAATAATTHRTLVGAAGGPVPAVDVAALLLGGGSLVLVDDDAPAAPWWGDRRAVIERDERVSR